MRTLPDLLRPGLELVFVGINPGEASARARHYYAHPGNRFWRELGASGLVSGLGTGPVSHLDDRRLLEAGIGFTDVVKRVVTDSAQVSDAELRAAAPAVRGRIAYARPRAVCFTSTRGFMAVFPRVRRSHGWGRQPCALEGATVWLMPSTSGRAAAFRAEGARVLRELALDLGIGVDLERPLEARRIIEENEVVPFDRLRPVPSSAEGAGSRSPRTAKARDEGDAA